MAKMIKMSQDDQDGQVDQVDQDGEEDDQDNQVNQNNHINGINTSYQRNHSITSKSSDAINSIKSYNTHADESTVTGFLLTGIGQRGSRGDHNYMIVNKDTTD